MNVSEYIIEYLVDQGVHDYFGYQGTMIAHFIEAICNNNNAKNHSVYNEQGAAFAACGYAKATGNCGVAYATSGPGALNLVSGIADAYYDSAPVIFITGQINTTEYTNIPELRQQGFQQTDVVAITSPICKYAVKITKASQIQEELEKAWILATTGRKGPVVLDIPMDIQKAEFKFIKNEDYKAEYLKKSEMFDFSDEIIKNLNQSKRPILFLGNGIQKDKNARERVKQLISKWNIPVITSILAKDLVDTNHKCNLGFLGAAYGSRAANIVAYKKADLIISLGSSMCRRQTGNPEQFAQNAQIIRVDIDQTQLKRKVHKDEISFQTDVNLLIEQILQSNQKINDFSDWVQVCKRCREVTEEYNNNGQFREPNFYIKKIGELFENTIFSIDVGQHMMWAAQSLSIKNGIQCIYSGGHGAMGIALPASIGAYYATGKKSVCIVGDGSFQMNIQELQWVVREQIPITIFVMNNHVLGLIRQQQDDFFGSRYYGSSEEGGFSSPDFVAIAKAYGLDAYQINSVEDICNLKQEITGDKPVLVEVMMPVETKAYPKTFFGQEMHNQRPEISAELMNYLLEL